MQKVKIVLCIIINMFIFGFLVYFLNNHGSGIWSVNPWGAHTFVNITTQIVVIILPLIALALSILLRKSKLKIVMILLSLIFVCRVSVSFIMAWYWYLAE